MKKIKKITLISSLIFSVIFTAAFSLETVFDPKIPKSSAELGEILFMDPILSRDSTISCASCHKPEFAFADTMAFSIGVGGIPTSRNTPTVTYMNNRNVFFWDGRAKSLEEQALGPITHPHEMNLSIPEAVQRLRASEYYQQAFLRVYHRAPDSLLLLKSIADFERTLETYDSPYDRFLAGDNDAMSESALHGMILFFKEQTCNTEPCHSGTDLGADSLVSLGIFTENDKGLFNLTKDSADIGKFKSVHLRNIAITAPFMHNGSKKTLREVVTFYNDPKNFRHKNVHSEVKVVTITLSEQQIDDMIAFMESLTDERYLPLLDKRKKQERATN